MTDPTIDHFSDWIGYHLDQSIQALEKEILELKQKFMFAGRSTRDISTIKYFELARPLLDKAIDETLGKLVLVRENSNLNPEELREVTERKLTEFVANINAMIEHSGGQTKIGTDVITREAPKLRQHLNFALQQYDAGLLVPPAAGQSPTMSISIDTMSLPPKTGPLFFA